MYNKIYIGQNAAGVFAAPAFAPISRIALLVDDENEYLSGDDSGRTLEVTCPYGSQAMADALLAQLKGYAYQPMTAQDALLDPAAEIGDGVTVGGVYTILAQIDRLFDMHCAADIAAPGEEELESEYTFQTQERRLERKLAQTRSLIEKTAEQIALRITSAEAESLIKQRLDSIELSVSSSKGSTTFTLTSDGAELSSETLGLSVNAVNITGKLTAKQIDATDLKVNVANITGTLYIGDLEDDVGLVTKDNVTTITSNAIKTAKISADQITSGTLTAAELSLDGAMALTEDGEVYGYMGVNEVKGGPCMSDSSGNIGVIVTNNAAKISYQEDKMIWVADGGCYSSYTMQVYSDKRLKKNISYDLGNEEKLFTQLQACSFEMNSDENGKTRWGFLAQDLIAAAAEAGMDADKLAIIGSYNGMYSIAYGELTALNTHMIQKLMARVAELEENINAV